MTQELLTVQELADRLRVQKSWVYSRTRRRGGDGIPHLRVGKYARFIEVEVMKWLQSKTSQDLVQQGKGVL